MTVIGRTGFIPRLKMELIAPEKFKTQDISLIIPVKDNQKGIDNFLLKFKELGDINLGLREIIIVDNNSRITVTVRNDIKTSLKIIMCSFPGPAAARNKGVKEATGEWILFMDSDCEMTITSISGYLESSNGALAYAGGIIPSKNDLFSKYYFSQETLIPPELQMNGISCPEYLITANCLIWKKVLNRIGGFNEDIKIAAGEDIDLGFRIREYGKIAYANDSKVLHHFEAGFFPFVKRFYRYGMGNKYLSELYEIDVRPRLFHPIQRNFINYILGFIQWGAMFLGYWTRKKK
jgi:GT2 family glycosyltransferase